MSVSGNVHGLSIWIMIMVLVPHILQLLAGISELSEIFVVIVQAYLLFCNACASYMLWDGMCKNLFRSKSLLLNRQSLERRCL